MNLHAPHKTEAEGQISYRRVPAEELVPRLPMDYIPTGLEGYLRKKLFGEPLLLRGPKGAGKTFPIEYVLAEGGFCMLRHPCTEDDTPRHLFGARVCGPTRDGLFFRQGGRRTGGRLQPRCRDARIGCWDSRAGHLIHGNS